MQQRIYQQTDISHIIDSFNQEKIESSIETGVWFGFYNIMVFLLPGI